MRELLKFTGSDHYRITLAILHPQKAFIIIPGEHACMSCFHGYSLHIPEFVLSYHLHLLVRSLTGVLLSPEFVLSHSMHLLVRSLTGAQAWSHDQLGYMYLSLWCKWKGWREVLRQSPEKRQIICIICIWRSLSYLVCVVYLNKW